MALRQTVARLWAEFSNKQQEHLAKVIAEHETAAQRKEAQTREQLIETYGGKGGIIKGLLDERVDIEIPPTAFLLAGEPVASIREVFNSMKKPVIVRGSNPGDYHGLVGAIPSIAYVNTWKQFQAAIRRIYAIKDNIPYKHYAGDEGADLENTHILLQEQKQMPYRAIVIRHPNQPDIVEICISAYYEGHSQDWQTDIVDENNDEDINLGTKNLSNFNVPAILDVLHKIERAKVIDQSFAQQLEIGFIGEETVFYQARPFKQKQVADFRLVGTDAIESVALPYGITDEKGIELSVVQAQTWNRHHGTDITKNRISIPPHDFALIANFIFKGDDYPLDMSYKGMRVFIEPKNNSHLAHGSYRYHQKAEVSFVIRPGDIPKLQKCDRIRVTSDGYLARVEPVR